MIIEPAFDALKSATEGLPYINPPGRPEFAPSGC